MNTEQIIRLACKAETLEALALALVHHGRDVPYLRDLGERIIAHRTKLEADLLYGIKCNIDAGVNSLDDLYPIFDEYCSKIDELESRVRDLETELDDLQTDEDD